MSYRDDEVMQKIYDLRRTFMSKYALVPNTIYLGYDEYYTLVDAARIVDNNELQIRQVLGMKVNRITKESHVSLGLVIE